MFAELEVTTQYGGESALRNRESTQIFQLRVSLSMSYLVDYFCHIAGCEHMDKVCTNASLVMEQ